MKGTSTQFGLIPAFILSAAVLFGAFCAFWYGLAGIAWLIYQPLAEKSLVNYGNYYEGVTHQSIDGGIYCWNVRGKHAEICP